MSPDARPARDDWNRHWHEYARSNALNPAQAYRSRLIVQALELTRASGPIRFLELGSGQGEFSALVEKQRTDLELVGLDLSQAAVELARARVPNAKFFQHDLTEPVAIPERYRGWASHAVCSEVLEHLDDPLTALRHLRAWLAPAARLVITVPAGPMSAFDRHIGHRHHFTQDRLGQLLSDAGLEVLAQHAAGFPFFNLYRLLVIARGRRLIAEASGELPFAARLSISAFSGLFRLNMSDTPYGWQLLAIAEEPRGVEIK